MKPTRKLVRTSKKPKATSEEIRAAYLETLNEKLHWFANTGPYQDGGGFKDTVESVIPQLDEGQNVWSLLYGAEFDPAKPHLIETGVRAVIGADQEYRIKAKNPRNPSEQYISNLVSYHMTSVIAMIGRAPHADKNAMLSKLPAFHEDFHRIVIGDDPQKPNIVPFIRRWEIHSQTRHRATKACGELFKKEREEHPFIDPVYDAIVKHFYNGDENAFMNSFAPPPPVLDADLVKDLWREVMRDKLGKIFSMQMGDYLADQIELAMYLYGEKDHRIAHYLANPRERGDKTPNLVYPQRDDYPWLNHQEVRYAPIPMEINDTIHVLPPDAPFGMVAVGANTTDHVRNHMHSLRILSDATDGRADFVRAHVHYSMDGFEDGYNLFLDDEGEFNVLSKLCTLGVDSLGYKGVMKNSHAVNYVNTSPRKYGSRPNHYEYRNVYKQSEFEERFPELAAAGLTAFDLSVLEVLEGMRQGVKAIGQFIPELKGEVPFHIYPEKKQENTAVPTDDERIARDAEVLFDGIAYFPSYSTTLTVKPQLQMKDEHIAVSKAIGPATKTIFGDMLAGFVATPQPLRFR